MVIYTGTYHPNHVLRQLPVSTMFALFEAGLQRKHTEPKPHAASLRSLHGANHVAPLRGADGS